MFKLADKYASRPAEELPLLFQRILQNSIRDFFRRQKVRTTWTTALSSLFGNQEDDDSDPLDSLEVDRHSSLAERPAEQLEQKQLIEIITKAVESLPVRQRQAFMLRYWEEFDVAETAKVMGCSEGSVKTHCSRATRALELILKNQGITL
jgi:RNA polymerase sigma-70 factor (ECF subfamily)